MPAGIVPINVAWVANNQDNRFGKVLMKVTGGSANQPYLVVSRTMFADSFKTAVDVLWGGHRGTTAFREGEILVMISMDPFDQLEPEQWKTLDQERALLKDKISRLSVDGKTKEEIIRDNPEIRQDALSFVAKAEKLSLRRRIVTHPALFGRELAWSVARVDFWFNNLKSLSEE